MGKLSVVLREQEAAPRPETPLEEENRSQLLAAARRAEMRGELVAAAEILERAGELGPARRLYERAAMAGR